MATTLVDQYTLSQDSTFQKRVQAAVQTTAIAIHAEAFTAKTPQRDNFGKQVLQNMPMWINQLALAVAVDPTVAGLAGSPPVQASVTDASISNAISAAWEAFAYRFTV